MPHLTSCCEKLCNLIANGVSIVKENAATTLATFAERVEEEFIPYFMGTIDFLIK
jgi:hypothetical protein